MSQIDHIYYINLEYRTDRKAAMEFWFDEANTPTDKITRVNAFHLPGRGHIGCTISHIETLKAFLESPHNTCIVFEDDFEPFKASTFWADLDAHLSKQPPFDILMLASNMLESTPTEWDAVRKVSKCYTSSGYVITREFAPRLLQNLVEGLQLAEQYEQTYKSKANDFCLDVHWEKLMPHCNWFAIVPPLGRQRASYSDIDGVFANRDV